MPVSDEDFNALKNSVRALADQINTFQASMGGLQNRIDALQSSMDEKFMDRSASSPEIVLALTSSFML